MPQTDFVEVQINLSAATAPRPTLAVALLLHDLTDAQDALMGTPRTRLLTPQTWVADMAALGITSGEQAYVAARAHFSQPRSPARAFLGRRGKAIQQVWTVVVPAVPTNGVHAIAVAVNGVPAVGSPYAFTASSSTQAAVRTALLSALAAGSATFAAAAGGGAGDITLTAVAGLAGTPLQVTVQSPSSTMTASVTTGTSVVAVAQLLTGTIVTAALGTYTLTVQTTTSQKVYSHIATTGATVTTIRDALKVLYDANPSDLYGTTLTSVSTNQFTMTASLAGRSGTVTLTSPISDATLVVTTANYGIADDWTAAKNENFEWLVGIPGSKTAAELLLSDAWFATDKRRMLGVQTSDADVLTATAGNIGALLKARASLYTFGVHHDINAEGVVEAWTGDVTTDPPGSVDWVGKPLVGLTGRSLTATQASNLRSYELSFLEDFAARDGQDIMNGGYSFAGRPIDITRSLLAFQFDAEASMMDLRVSARTLPYSTIGQAKVLGVIQGVIDRAIAAGYGVQGTFTITFLPIGTATPANDRQRGIMPQFYVTGTIQAGTHKINMRADLTQ